MTYTKFIDAIEEAVKSLADCVARDIHSYSDTVAQIDERIDDTFHEYEVSNEDYQSSFRDDLENLIGQRRALYDELETVVEDAKSVLAEILQCIQDEIDRLDTLENDDRVPRFDDYTIPSV